jgi:hypothetical protein
MSQQEAEAFENDPLFELHILLRKWDEEAKIMNVPIIGMELLKEKCKAALSPSF